MRTMQPDEREVTRQTTCRHPRAAAVHALLLLALAAVLAACSGSGGSNGQEADDVWSPFTHPKDTKGSTGDDDGTTEDSIFPFEGFDNGADCVDNDADGFGDGCTLGQDCDDSNPHFTIYCPPCQNGIYEGCPCTNAGVMVSCFPGDPSLIGQGVCKAGQQLCENGYWSACDGYVDAYPEECDGQDNNCDGYTDEGVLSPCGDCDKKCDVVNAGPGKQTDFDPTAENSSGVGLNVDGFIVLDSTKVNMAAIWISNSGEQTVSKLDTKTGKETGRYKICSDPSRTSVDIMGDVWVGCRGDGGVAKIHVYEGQCQDKNGNGSIETSKDLDGDGKITGGEMLPKDQDECVKFIVYPGGGCQRALGVDKQNHAWAGDWNNAILRRLKPEDGSVVQEISIPAQPYGLVIDKNNIIWVSGRGGNKLVRIDPSNGNVQALSSNIGCFEPYGITLDWKGRPWMANCCCSNVAYRYDPQSGAWAAASTHSRPRGLVGTFDGRIFVANDQDDQVAVVDADSAQTLTYVSLGGGRFPIGMTVDFDGFVWAVNQSSSSASKIDGKNLNVVGEYPTGSSPYTYSDMTGYLLHTFTNPTGFYTQVFGGWGLRVKWTALVVDAYIPAGAYIKVRVRTAQTQADLAQTQWSDYFGPFPPAQMPIDLIPLNLSGHYLEVEVTLYSDGDSGTPMIKAIEVQFDAGQGANN